MTMTGGRGVADASMAGVLLCLLSGLSYAVYSLLNQRLAAVCDRVVLVKGTVLAYGPTETTFTRANLERAFGGVLRHFTLGGDALHDDDDARAITIFTDDERPLVHYGEHLQRREDRANEDRANEDRE